MEYPINKKILDLQTIIASARIPNTVMPDAYGGRLVCANQKFEDQSLGGGSIWFAYREKWYVGTWGPRVYRVPDLADLLSLCRNCLASRPSASRDLSPETLSEFKLVEVQPESIWQ